MKKKEKIKNCPLCGKKAHLWNTDTQYYIECSSFSMETKNRHLVQVSGQTKEEVIRNWNKRK